jgi:DNA replication licensing factor MCM6
VEARKDRERRRREGRKKKGDGATDAGADADGGPDEESQDVEMSNVESSAMEESAQESFTDGSAVAQAGTSSRAQSMVAEAPPPARPKKRFIITHDKYMQLQNLVILQLSEHERLHQRGMDRDELIDWYLESKEAEIQDVEELEYEKELITKMLKKLVRVNLLLFLDSNVRSNIVLPGQLSHRGGRRCARIVAILRLGANAVLCRKRCQREEILYGPSFG